MLWKTLFHSYNLSSKNDLHSIFDLVAKSKALTAVCKTFAVIQKHKCIFQFLFLDSTMTFMSTNPNSSAYFTSAGKRAVTARSTLLSRRTQSSCGRRHLSKSALPFPRGLVPCEGINTYFLGLVQPVPFGLRSNVSAGPEKHLSNPFRCTVLLNFPVKWDLLIPWLSVWTLRWGLYSTRLLQGSLLGHSLSWLWKFWFCVQIGVYGGYYTDIWMLGGSFLNIFYNSCSDLCL